MKTITAALAFSAAAAWADPTPAPTQAPQFAVRVDALAGYVMKPGSGSQYFGMRAAADYSMGADLMAAGRLEAARQSDGGGTDVKLTDPTTFDSLEGTLAVAARASAKAPVWMIAAAGETVPYQKGKAAVLNSYPKTLFLGAWVRLAPTLWLMAGGGTYEPAGKGPAGIFSLQAPIKADTTVLVDAAVGKAFLARFNVAVCTLSCGKAGDK